MNRLAGYFFYAVGWAVLAGIVVGAIWVVKMVWIAV